MNKYTKNCHRSLSQIGFESVTSVTDRYKMLQTSVTEFVKK